MPARVTRKWVSGISTHRVSIRPFHPALDTVSRRVPTFRTLLSSPPAAVDLHRPPIILGVRSNVSHERVLGQTVPPSAAAYLPRRLLGSRRSPAWPPESCRPALPCQCSRLSVPASKRVWYWRPFRRPIPRRVKRSKKPWHCKRTRFKEDAATRPAGAAWGVCWPAGRVHAWTGGATAGTGHPQSVGCAHLELHASLRAPRAALAPPTAWRATAAPEAQPRAMELVQIVVRARPAAHDTICHRRAALHAWQFGRCWDMPPAPPAACVRLCAGRAMLSPLEGLRPSAARTTSCWTGCAVALAALRQHCALGNCAGAMQRQGSASSAPATRRGLPATLWQSERYCCQFQLGLWIHRPCSFLMPVPEDTRCVLGHN